MSTMSSSHNDHVGNNVDRNYVGVGFIATTHIRQNSFSNLKWSLDYFLIRLTAEKIPVGPFMLSVHPGRGDPHIAPTIDGRMTMTGRVPASSCSCFSASAFVRV